MHAARTAGKAVAGAGTTTAAVPSAAQAPTVSSDATVARVAWCGTGAYGCDTAGQALPRH